VPLELDAVVKQATSVRPEDRFANADELRRALAVFIPPEVHPELWLSLAMKEIFAPEQERAERRQMVEASRHLLDDEGAPERRRARSGSLPKPTAAALAASSIRRKLRWLAPMAVGALVGLCALLWLLLTAERNKQAVVAVPASETVSRSSAPQSASPAAQAQVRAPAPGGSRVSAKPPAPAVAPPPVGVPRASPEEKGPAVPGTVKRLELSADVPAPGVKFDHLSLAREAFNVRDWARALEEGKRAVTAGGGAESHAVVGNTYFKMGRFAEAEQEYTKAIALDPANMLLRDRLSIAHARVQESTMPAKP
jgi:tetratricopeptide (TPR) repeat protein